MKKNIFKKYLSVILLSTMSIGLLSACGTDTAIEDLETQLLAEGIREEYGLFWDIENATYLLEPEIASGESQLTLWADSIELAQFVAESFMEAHPGTIVNYNYMGATDSIDRMILDGEAGLGADVFLIPHDHVATAHNSRLIGMMGSYEEEIARRFISSSVETVTIDGNIHGIPWVTETIGLFYNKTLLNELYRAGVIDSPEPATDFNQIIELAYLYNNLEDRLYTLRWSAGDPYMSFAFISAFGTRVFGEHGIDSDSPGFNTPETIEGLYFFKSLRPIWDVNSGDITLDFTTMAFAEGKTPYLIMGPWGIEPIMQGSIENDFQFGVVPLPLMNGNQPYTFSGNQIIVVSSHSQYPAAARVLAMHMASDEVLTYLFEEQGKIPALQPQYAAQIPGLLEDENVRGIMEQAQYSIPMSSIQEKSFWWGPAAAMFESVWDGSATPEEAAIRAEEEFGILRQTAR